MALDSMTFLINDSTASTGTQPLLQVTITANADGTVTFSITQIDTAGAALGDLRGLFFDLADESLLGSLTSTATSGLTEMQQGNDSVVNLGDGATMAGLVGDNGGYDVGIEIGTSGLSKDDIRSFSFTLDSSMRDLTLADFSGVSFGARLTSVGIDLDGNGTIDTARTGSTKVGEVSFQTITPVDDSATVPEDAVATGNVLANDGAGVGDTLSVTGWTGGALGTAIAPATLSGATVTLNADGSYVVDASGADALAAGQTVVQTFTYTVLQTNVDGTSSHTASFTVTITGTNDAPTVSAFSNGSITEDAATPDLTTTVSVDFSDVDLSDTLSYSAVKASGSLGGSLVLLNSDDSGATAAGSVSYTYSVPNSATQFLAAGQTASETFTISAADGHGGSVSQTVTVTITGTNDAPTVSAFSNGSITEDAATPDLTTTVSVDFSDVDLSDTLSYSAVKASGSLGGSLVLLNSDDSGATAAGSVSYTYSVPNSATQFLAAGQTASETFTISAADGHGGSVSQTVTVTITGTNDVPVAQVSTAAVFEDALLSESVSGTDADTGQTATLTYALVGAAPVGLTFNPNGSYTFDASSYDSLKDGEQLVLTVPFTASDATSTSTAANLVITITGTNDAPVAVADTKAATEDTTVTGSVATNDSDIDHDAVLGYTLNAPVAGLTLNASGTYSFDAGNAAYQSLAAGQTTDVVASYTVTDEHGASSTSTLTITVTGVAEATVMTPGSGGPGSDTLTGSTGNDVLYGGPSGDLLYGEAGNDALFGDQAVDSLHGGLGNDTLTGGAGNDLYYFDTALSSTNIDTIVGENGDLIMLDNTVFGLGTSGTLAATAFKSLSGSVDADDRILYDTATGNLFFDADGSGSGSAVQFATVTGTLQGAIDAGDFRLVP